MREFFSLTALVHAQRDGHNSAQRVSLLKLEGQVGSELLWANLLILTLLGCTEKERIARVHVNQLPHAVFLGDRVDHSLVSDLFAQESKQMGKIDKSVMFAKDRLGRCCDSCIVNLVVGQGAKNSLSALSVELGMELCESQEL